MNSCKYCKADCALRGEENSKECNGYIPMTNADQIRSMSDEELAELLIDGCRGSNCDDQPQNEFGSVNCFQCMIKWLQKPAEPPKEEGT